MLKCACVYVCEYAYECIIALVPAGGASWLLAQLPVAPSGGYTVGHPERSLPPRARPATSLLSWMGPLVGSKRNFEIPGVKVRIAH